MANVAWASGHLLCSDDKDRAAVLKKINLLPDKPYESAFSIWKGIFHAPLEPNRAGYIITFGLSHKYFGEIDEIVKFLDFWEEFISDLPAQELFMSVEQEFCSSYELFGKFYFQWKRDYFPKSSESRWIFYGTAPIDETWQSKFETKIEEEEDEYEDDE